MEKEEYRKVTPVEKVTGLKVNNEDRLNITSKRERTTNLDFDSMLKTEMKKLDEKDNQKFKEAVYNLDKEQEELDEMLKEDSAEDIINVMNGYRKF